MTSSWILTMKISLAIIAAYPAIHPFMKVTMLNALHLITPTINLNLSTLTMTRTIHPVMAMATNLDNPPLHSLKPWNLQLNHLLKLVVNRSITLMTEMTKKTQTLSRSSYWRQQTYTMSYLLLRGPF